MHFFKVFVATLATTANIAMAAPARHPEPQPERIAQVYSDKIKREPQRDGQVYSDKIKREPQRDGQGYSRLDE
ncbi:uncharacterized protein N7446_001413 [Penicillium canescens]|uniref:Uncharacterized protein n=1 Tax=Penicillium canescens TaxID=5083 RepID=A0AAD6ID41_PENCN|nr:uncharacterized protein N7446_001413 [Penicillium canescens]KAJ6043218.1 hypothetical protein N7460_004573 [Penicillium canescens]KAJ6054693.1 hypothetical protein N7444_003791 [Penicillium canescens]KAJ6073636.1 hypothetical protein N7446_001413 [Penicillium canescens]